MLHVTSNRPGHCNNEDVREQIWWCLDEIRHEIGGPRCGHDLCCVSTIVRQCRDLLRLTDGKKSLYDMARMMPKWMTV